MFTALNQSYQWFYFPSKFLLVRILFIVKSLVKNTKGKQIVLYTPFLGPKEMQFLRTLLESHSLCTFQIVTTNRATCLQKVKLKIPHNLVQVTPFATLNDRAFLKLLIENQSLNKICLLEIIFLGTTLEGLLSLSSGSKCMYFTWNSTIDLFCYPSRFFSISFDDIEMCKESQRNLN